MYPLDELLDITEYIEDAILDVRYATTNNFAGQRLYKKQAAWLRREPLQKLVTVAAELRKQDYRLVIFDAYRPKSVQDKLRSVCSDNDYVEPVSNHCRGITVDLTLANEAGVLLDMGTDYDDFSPKAHSGTKLISGEQQANRKILAEAMLKQGFAVHPYEWWHFDYQDGLTLPIILDSKNDLSFETPKHAAG